MSTIQEAARLIDPGEGGWAEEPKVSQAERVLFGDLAGVVRNLGLATVAAGDAYSLTCKHAETDVHVGNGEADVAHREAIQATYQLYENATAVHREIAAKAIGLRRRAGLRHGTKPEAGSIG